MDALQLSGALSSWRAMCDAIEESTELELHELMTAELAGEKRPPFLLRLYGRFNNLRTAREKQELLQGKAP